MTKAYILLVEKIKSLEKELKLKNKIILLQTKIVILLQFRSAR